MGNIKLKIACDKYDLLEPLARGIVKPQGVDLEFMTMMGGDRHDQMMRGEFDLCEFSLASYLIARNQKLPFIGIPVFPRRMFGHKFVFCNTNAGINKPEDLIGKNVGIHRYSNTLAVWFKGLLQHFYNVFPKDIVWFVAKGEIVPFPLPKGVRVQALRSGEKLSPMLEAGQLDAVIAPEMIEAWLKNSPQIRRLFPNFKDVEMSYFNATGDFPIMHLIVGREEIFKGAPWLAKSLFKAFELSRDMCFENMERPTHISFAWGRALLEEEKTVLGENRWPYGLRLNRKGLERIINFAVEQNLIPEAIPVERLFYDQGEIK